MQNTFPGSLPRDAATNKDNWDEVGDNLEHSNTLGARGGKFKSAVNFRYGWEAKAKDGKRYCAVELDEPSAEKLKEVNDVCDLKILLYDRLGGFGHWVDVNSVNGSTINFQDYDQSGNAIYDEDNENLDFSRASNTTTGEHFDADNPVVGNGIGESVYFYAVCECEREGRVNLKIPALNLSFEQRRRNPMRQPSRN
jgi:hypothetical protein